MLPGAVDVHVHYLSATYRKALASAGIGRPDGFPHVPTWSAAAALSAMDDLGIALSFLSLSSPGVSFMPTVASQAKLARAVNEEGAAAVASRPDRFGLLASLPLPDVESSLAEIAHAGDTLGADGFCLLTNYAGTYLSDSALEPVLAELDRRNAVVALHPASPPGFEVTSLGRPRPMLEFPFDTTRVVIALLLDGTFRRHRSIRWIVPHSGSALPVMVDRVQEFASAFLVGPDDPALDIAAELGRLHYDVTGPTVPHALPALLALAQSTQLLYGSDFPFPPVRLIEGMADALVHTTILSDSQRTDIFSATAAELFPRAAANQRSQ